MNVLVEAGPGVEDGGAAGETETAAAGAARLRVHDGTPLLAFTA